MIIAKLNGFVNEGDIFVTFIVKMLNNRRWILYSKYYNIYLKKRKGIDII